jgi:glyoxylase-like metal-dependent hydrolase (beta-lactamase superfamily II)
VQKGDRDPILAPRPAGQPSRVPDPKFFEGLADSKTVLLNDEDHDVFGDGTVVIKSTPGHTPGHQSLFLKLANTGNVLLSGDLYHYPEEITYKKVPATDPNREQTAKSRGRQAPTIPSPRLPVCAGRAIHSPPSAEVIRFRGSKRRTTRRRPRRTRAPRRLIFTHP